MAYNIFTTLHLERKELIHSSMIAAIASNNDECQSLFFQMLSQKGDDEKINALHHAIIEEKYVHWINTEHKLTERVGCNLRNRGMADIWIGNKSQPLFRIIIENKINARNQDHQLRRYYRYLIGDNRVNAGLFYLCLKDDEKRRNGACVSAKCFRNETVTSPTAYTVITYKEDITQWLRKILLLTSIEEDFRKAVEQYLDIIIEISK